MPPIQPVTKRRALTNVGGEIETSGDREAASILAHAIDVTPSNDEDAEDRAHVHGFHSYPARAHPITVRRLVEELVPEQGTVLDPFCGSGTVLIESMLSGRDAIGSDLNPLAVMLSRAKTFPHPAAKTEALVLAAQGVAEFADAKRKAKSGASKRLPQEDVSSFAPHVLLELSSIRDGIAKAPPETRPELMLVLSSILVKLSARRGDTTHEQVEKRVAAGFPARLFVKKTEDLARRFDELFESMPKPAPRARVYEDDATMLSKVEDDSIDSVITSPPYVATYDYLQHHELRLRWLGLDARKLARGELGARRNYVKLGGREATASWEDELAKLFTSLSRVMRRDATMVLLIADSAQMTARGAIAIRADDVVSRVARKLGTLEPVAAASQARPHFHGPTQAAFRERPRYEHALLLTRR